MASFGRKKVTIRAIDSILKQDINNWESLIIGDGCPVIQEFIDSNYYKDIQLECNKNGNDLIIENNPINRGGHGYFIINENIKRAIGTYLVNVSWVADNQPLLNFNCMYCSNKHKKHETRTRTFDKLTNSI